MLRTLLQALAWLLVSAAVGLLLGGATSFAQQLLPDELRSFANSNGGWTLLAFATIVVALRWDSARRWWLTAGIGLVIFHCLLQGYAIVSTLRGFPDSYGPGSFYFIVATLAGPVLGLAALAWRAESRVLRAVGTAVFAAVMVGDGAWGLLTVLESTSWVWWTLSIAIGVGVLAWTLVRRLDRVRDRVLALTLTAAGAAAFVAVFTVIL